jgi:hypothetical protein
VDSDEQELALVEAGGHWAAVFYDEREELPITVLGRSPAPGRLDLRPL